MKFRFLMALALAAMSILAATAAMGAADSPREFAPVQGGFVDKVDAQLPYATDHILVKFTVDGMLRSNIRVNRQKGAAAPTTVTGLNSLDAVGTEIGVTAITRPYITLKNQAESARLGVDRWFRFDLGAGADIQRAVEAYAADPNVEAVSPDWIAYPAAVPNDPLHPDHWGHNNTVQLPDLDWGGTYAHTLPNTVGTAGFDANAQTAWDTGYGSASVVIAILDSGVDAGHPDLRQVTGYDYGDNDSNPDDNSSDPGHGTACAGIAGSINNNGLGAAGIAGGCSIMPLKVANSAGTMYFSAIQNAIYHAADNGADIISMSLGAAISSDTATDNAITYAYNAGLTILAATGNENASTISYPAINANTISVGAASPCGDRKRSSSSSAETNPGVNTDPNGYTCDGERWWGSNYGTTSKDARTAVDILGPTILPTTDIQGSAGYDPGNYSGFFNGTSCATPYVAGVAALIKSQNPSWTPAQIREQLTSTAQDITNVESGGGWDRYSGYGMVDAAAAVGGGTTPTPPTAEFSANITSGDAPLGVNFTDASTNSPTSWSWTFGDGGTSSSQNPSYTYTSAGSYTVSLTVSNADGNDTMTKNGYITVTDPPVGGGFCDDFNDGDASDWSATGGTWSVVGGQLDGIDAGYVINVAPAGDVGAATIDVDWTSLTGGSWTNGMIVFGYQDAQNYRVVDCRDGANKWYIREFIGGSSSNKAQFAETINTNQQYALKVTIEASGLVTLTADGVQKVSYNFGNVITGKVGLAVQNSHSQFDNFCVDTGGGTPTPPVAAFVADTTSGTAPLSVNFTDQSTNSPTSWSWTFGDGGSSNAQNPSYSYTTAGSYTVSLTVTNADGNDTMTKVDYITVTSGGGGGQWVEITYDDFEAGMGNYTDGGNDMYRYTGGTYAYEGSAAAAVQDNSGVASSFYHTNGYDTTGYVDMEVNFFFIAVSMDGTENFFVEYYNGSSWIIVANFVRGTDFENNTWYEATVTIPTASVDYSSNGKLRFRCDASGNRDDVYIDAITWRGLTAGGAAPIVAMDKQVLPNRLAVSSIFPNPFNPKTTIAFAVPQTGHTEVRVYDLAGRLVKTLLSEEMRAGMHQIQWLGRDNTGSSVASGVYMVRITASGEQAVHRMTLIK